MARTLCKAQARIDFRCATRAGYGTARKKPHPEPLRLALWQMGLEAECCVYVGDAPQDVEMARRAGVLAIGVLGPFPTEKRLRAARPEFLIRSLEELPGVLNRLRDGAK